MATRVPRPGEAAARTARDRQRVHDPGGDQHRLIPTADNAAASLPNERSNALARLGGGLVALIVVVRLYATG
jgi:hypothetical protein